MPAPKRRFDGLWRHPDFLRLWLGQTVSEFGSMLGAIGLLAILTLAATPAQVGLLETFRALPALLFGLFAGVWVDRRSRRPLLIVADIGRFALLILVFSLALLGVVNMMWLYVTAFLIGCLTVLFNIAYRSYLPALVPRADLVEANSKLSATASLAEISAPALGGLLVQAVSATLAIFVDGLTYLVSAIAIGRIKAEEPAAKPPAQRAVAAEIKSGLRFVWQERPLRALALGSGTRDFFGGFFAALYAIYVLREIGLSPAVLGLLIGAGGIGAFFGALWVGRFHRRLGIGRTLIATMLFMGIWGWLVPLASFLPKTGATAVLFLGQLFSDTAFAIYIISELSLRQHLTPDPLLGRMNASFEFFTRGLGTIGIFVGGLAGTSLGLRTSFIIAVSGIMGATLWLIFSPIREMKSAP